MPNLIAAPAQAGPKTHALVIGVSRYRHIGDGEEPTEAGEALQLEQLSSAARSASEIARWLLPGTPSGYRNPEAPLASLRVLLSPSDGEDIAEEIAALLPAEHAATRAAVQDEFLAFKKDAESDRDNVAIVYVAGHGVQLSKRGAVVLLEDVGDEAHPTLLHGAIDMVACHAAMNHTKGARDQFWFVDACRQRPDVARQFETMRGALAPDERIGQVNASPLYLAAGPRESAFARPNETSLFSEALLWAVAGGAARGPDALHDGYHVSVLSLTEALVPRVSQLAQGGGEEQLVEPTGLMRNAVFHRFEGRPRVRVQLGLSPLEPGTVASLLPNAQPPATTFDDWPVDALVDAGLYLLEVVPPAPFERTQQIVNASPPGPFATSVELERK